MDSNEDNKSYDDTDSQPSKKFLYALFNTSYNAHQQRSHDNQNLMMKKKAMLMGENKTVEVFEKLFESNPNQLKLEKDQINTFKQSPMINPLTAPDADETYMKQSFGLCDFAEEKREKEKEKNATPDAFKNNDEIKCDGSFAQPLIIEEENKNVESRELTSSPDSLDGDASDVSKTDAQEEKTQTETVKTVSYFKESEENFTPRTELKDSQKFNNSGSWTQENFDLEVNNYDDEKKILDADKFESCDYESLQKSLCLVCQNPSLPHTSDSKTYMDPWCLLNALSPSLEDSAYSSNMSLNITNSMVTLSINNNEDKRLYMVSNMKHNNHYGKDADKAIKSMENLQKTSDGKKECEKYSPDMSYKQSEKSGDTQLLFPLPLKGKGRKRSGSNKKSRGKQGGRHRSRKKSNSTSGRNDCRQSGSVDNGGYSNMGSGGSSSGEGGDGDDDEKERRKRGSSVRTCDDGKEDEDETDDENKTEEEVQEGLANLLLNSPDVTVKSMDKDLTHLLSDIPRQPSSVFEWHIDRETSAISSLFHEAPHQEIGDGSGSNHSCMSLNMLCDIIGAATSEMYAPKDDLFFQVNPCLTTLTHNMSQAYDDDLPVLQCNHCSILSSLMGHLAKCDSSTACPMCTQAYNLILQHVQVCIKSNRLQTSSSRADLCLKLCQSVKWDVAIMNSTKDYIKMMIKKYCNKVLNVPCDQEIGSTEMSVSDESKAQDKPSMEVEAKSNGIDSGKVEKETKQPGTRSGGHSYHSSLSRKPSNCGHRSIPPSISEQEEEQTEEKEDEGEEGKEDAIAILRRQYGAKADDPFGFSERDYVSSMPQGRINDQTQFCSFVSQAVGEKGVGEVVYSNSHQLRRVAGHWEHKKDEYKRSGKRPFQLAEEGVILSKFKHYFQILGTRYQRDFQWHKLTSLGSGMTGRCYLAIDTTTNFRFCVKKIKLYDYKKEELCLWAELDHVNVVTFYGALRHSDTVYLLTEYIDGGDLAHCINELKSGGQRLGHWLALTYFQQLLKLLVYLKSKNLLHEDIKAENLLLRANTFCIVLTDFGICHSLQTPVMLKNKVPAGTATHFSPEKAASLGHGFPACVWACVCVLVHMLSGQQPWNKYLKLVDCLKFTIYMKSPPLEDVPHNVRTTVKDLIAQGFTKEPENRPSAKELLKHEAFDILGQEPESYFSTLTSNMLSTGGHATRNAKEKQPVVTALKGTETNNDRQEEEEKLSLYEISIPQKPFLESQEQLIRNSSETHETKNDFTDMPQEKPKKDQDSTVEDVCEGAVGGVDPVQETYKKDVNHMNTAMVQGNDEHTKTQKTVYGEEVLELVDGRIPDLEQLLRSDEPIRSYLGDTSCFSTQVESSQVQLEIFNPLNAVMNDQLPILSIFNQVDSFLKPVVENTTGHCDSSENIDSSELFLPGPELENQNNVVEYMHTASFTERKTPNLKVDVTQWQLKHQTSKKSTNGTTSSSHASSVFFPGSAGSTFEDQQMGVIAGLDSKVDEETTEQDDECHKQQVNEVIENLRRSITEEKLGGSKLVLHDENGTQLLRVLISGNDLKIPCKDLIHIFKRKIIELGILHFELATMDGADVNYHSPLQVLELKIMAKPNIRQCWCAACQF